MDTPIELNSTAIEEFKAIYREEYGVDLSDGEAHEMAMRLLRLFALLTIRDGGSVDDFTDVR